jgi:hypothetical protein
MDHSSPEDGAIARTPLALDPLLFFPLAKAVVKALRSRSIPLVLMSTPTECRPAVFLVQAKDVDWECVVEIHTERNLVAFRSFLPISIPPDRIRDVAALAGHLNATRLTGHFAVDHATGTVSHVLAMCFTDGLPSESAILWMLEQNLTATDTNEAIFCVVAHMDGAPGDVLGFADGAGGIAA